MAQGSCWLFQLKLLQTVAVLGCVATLRALLRKTRILTEIGRKRKGFGLGRLTLAAGVECPDRVGRPDRAFRVDC